jgi:hypothetical protein
MLVSLKRECRLQALGEAFECPLNRRYYHSVKAAKSQWGAAAAQILLRCAFYGYRKLSQALARAGC